MIFLIKMKFQNVDTSAYFKGGGGYDYTYSIEYAKIFRSRKLAERTRATIEKLKNPYLEEVSVIDAVITII